MLLDKLVYPILLLFGQYFYFFIYLAYRNINLLNDYCELFLESYSKNESKEVFLVFIF